MKSVLIVLIASLLAATWAEESCSSKPDFRAPGRRPSEEKCREYNWERKCSSTQGVEVNEHPYLGAVAFSKDDGELIFSCVATLISPTFAVTAGHCLRSNFGLTPVFVRFGNKNIKAESVVDAKVIKKIIHPQHKAPSYSYDIGLLEFENPLPVTRAITPACLWSEEISNDAVDVSAWATTRGNKLPDTLQTMKAQIIDLKTCEPLLKNYFTRKFPKLEDHHLCVNETDTVNFFCSGSSGAPIVSSVPVDGGEEMPYAKAFATFGIRCEPSVGVYTKITSFVDWIERTVWGITPL